VARLALQTDAVVLAVAMIGTREAQPIGQAIPRLFMPITIRISQPVAFGRFRDRSGDPLVLRHATDEIMFHLSELSGQEYVNRYAKRTDGSEAGVAEHAAAGTRPQPDRSSPVDAAMARAVAG
jgi:1-acyl-sn-glycerol-3-phosphate acyltransferase